MTSEAKLDESQFFMNRFSSSHRLDRNCNGGGFFYILRRIYTFKTFVNRKRLFD